MREKLGELPLLLPRNREISGTGGGSRLPANRAAHRFVRSERVGKTTVAWNLEASGVGS